MTAPRIFSPQVVGDRRVCDLGEENLRYVKSVLRMKKGERLILFDGTGWEYEAVIRRFLSDGVSVEIVRRDKVPDKALKVTLFQALPKAGKMDFIVQKATELGVDRIVSFLSARSVPRLSPEKALVKTNRWQNIAVEAARQCGRSDVPEITEIFSFDDVVPSDVSGGLNLILWEEESETGLREVLRDSMYEGVKDISVVVGPEGGFSGEEVLRAVEKGFISVSLGRQVLKVETAALAILSIIQYEKGFWGGMRKGEENR